MAKLSPAEIKTASTVVCAAFAADMLGCAIPGTTPFESMRLALSMHHYSNSDAEAIRLRCCIWASKHRKAYLAEVKARVDRASKSRALFANMAPALRR